jgi:thioesterase domain-containing protein
LSRKAGLLRNKIEVRITGVLSNLLRRLGHRTLAALQRTHHNNVQAQMVYAPRSVYPGRVHLFRATKQPLGNYKFDPLYGWGPWAEGGVEVLEFPGYHGTFMDEPYVSVFAERLKACLRDAQAALKMNS